MWRGTGGGLLRRGDAGVRSGWKTKGSGLSRLRDHWHVMCENTGRGQTVANDARGAGCV